MSTCLTCQKPAYAMVSARVHAQTYTHCDFLRSIWVVIVFPCLWQQVTDYLFPIYPELKQHVGQFLWQFFFNAG